LERWQLDRIKDKVEELEGRLEVTIYTHDGAVYRIWYYKSDRVALYGKREESEGGEHTGKAFATTILEAVERGAKMAVNLSGDKKVSKWFGPEPDMAPAEELYKYVMGLA
jgi:hypothetical protein